MTDRKTAGNSYAFVGLEEPRIKAVFNGTFGSDDYWGGVNSPTLIFDHVI